MLSKKRAISESFNLIDRYKQVTIKENTLSNNNKEYHVTIQSSSFTYLFKLSHLYPFKAPLFFINNQIYKEWYRPDNEKIKNIIYHNLYKHQCPCCNTLICRWQATITMSMLIEEFKRWRETHLHAYNLLCIQKKMGQLYPIFNSNDIMNHITEYLIE